MEEAVSELQTIAAIKEPRAWREIKDHELEAETNIRFYSWRRKFFWSLQAICLVAFVLAVFSAFGGDIIYR